MRLLVIFFDGLGDRPAKELDGLTPLEAAHSPNVDRFAAEGSNGLLHAMSPGYPLGSPLALHLLFGYPESIFPDRGPLIARSRGVEMEKDDVIMSARLASATVDAGESLLCSEVRRVTTNPGFDRLSLTTALSCESEVSLSIADDDSLAVRTLPVSTAGNDARLSTALSADSPGTASSVGELVRGSMFVKAKSTLVVCFVAVGSCAVDADCCGSPPSASG